MNKNLGKYLLSMALGSVIATGVMNFNNMELRDKVTNYKKDIEALEISCNRLEESKIDLLRALEQHHTDVVNIDKFCYSLKEFIMYYNSSLTDDQAGDLAMAFTKVYRSDIIKHKNVFLYTIGVCAKESGFNVKAKNSKSSARGMGQIIYHYHPWLINYGISEKDLTNDPEKAIIAVYLVMDKYWVDSNYSYKRMIFRYRGRDYEKYYYDVCEAVNMFVGKLFK